MGTLKCSVVFSAALLTLSFVILNPNPALAVEPSYNLATVDGDTSEWNHSTDFISDMYKTGSPNGEVLAQLYMRYDCNTETMFVFVSSNGTSMPILAENGEEVWIKIGGKVVSSDDEGNGSTPDFDWVTKPFLGNPNYAKAWEASFFLTANRTYSISVHCNVWEDNESQTAAVYNLLVTVNCGELDYGDAPNSSCYGEAGHNIVYGGQGAKVKLGSTIDAEPSYDGNINADEDDIDGYADDEEAVTFYKKNPDGSYTQISGDKFKKGDDYRVVVHAQLYPGETAKLAAWFDFFADCIFGNEPEELIINNVTLSNGTSDITTLSYIQDFTVPAGATEALTYMRFRLDTQTADLGPTGIGNGYGEVEDYVTSIGSEEPVSVALVSFTASQMEYGVKIQWIAASEINHAGYNIFRTTSRDGEYHKINTELIKYDVSSSVGEKQYQYLDTDILSGDVFYKLEEMNLDGHSTWHGPIQLRITADISTSIELPTEYELAQNYPNPFNPVTAISYSLPEPVDMTLNIYDVQGKLVRKLVSGLQPAGVHTIIWDATTASGEPVPSGLYLYRMTAGEFSKVGRMTMLK
ncbi:T9SS C-terminal target domain-containing protein [candidate division KSB1 bacterium]|nr:T9SS type A sorting domain-containing protein [candidate division KSB1 bacterium]RQW01067.1 MAG: T9SS C-terminal target domain-containing protein [candidate division KSB1 bacterium]